MPNCEICGISCSDKIIIKMDWVMGYQDRKERYSKDIYYFCSALHQYRWNIGFHSMYYNSFKEVINHLVKAHDYDVKVLERALNLCLNEYKMLTERPLFDVSKWDVELIPD